MSQHIAIVEDEPAIRENYADAFRRAGYRVSAFAGRREALAPSTRACRTSW
jgi:two-component system, OmpR family, response regulator